MTESNRHPTPFARRRWIVLCAWALVALLPAAGRAERFSCVVFLQHPHHRFVPGVEAPDRGEAQRRALAAVAGATWANCNASEPAASPTPRPRPRGLESPWLGAIGSARASGPCVERARGCAAACGPVGYGQAMSMDAMQCRQRCESVRMTCAIQEADRVTGQPPAHPSLLTPSPTITSRTLPPEERARRALEAAVNGR